MVKANILKETDELIKGEKKPNPGYKNPEIAQAIAQQWKEEDLEKEKIIRTDDDIIKMQKVILSYYGKSDLAQQVLEVQPLYYDESKIWWAWDKLKFRWKIIDETTVLNFVNRLSVANTIKSKEKSEILEALKQESRFKKPREMKPTWIQFKDIIFDIKTGEEFPASPRYFVTNPIPWELHHSRFIETPVMDKIFEEWVGKEYVKSLYEILAYCLLPDYPIHRLFCLIGGGMNGKSCFLNLLRKFIGKNNVTATELDTLMTSRFEVTRLYNKLVCVMGETNFGELSRTSILKKLTGQDVIGFEFKNKNPFEEVNYAKILIATNNLPTTTDKTIGFYRRWMIIDFPNQFSEQKNILDDIPDEEYEILSVKCLAILKELLDKKRFHNEGTLDERIKKYEDKSNPFEKFWKENVIEDYSAHIWKHEFRDKINDWCKEHRFRELTDMHISKEMKEKSIDSQQIQADFTNNEGKKPIWRAWVGVKWK